MGVSRGGYHLIVHARLASLHSIRAFCAKLEDLVAEKMLGAASRLDRMVNMFQHAIVVCIKPSPEAMRRLQRHLAEAG